MLPVKKVSVAIEANGVSVDMPVAVFNVTHQRGHMSRPDGPVVGVVGQHLFCGAGGDLHYFCFDGHRRVLHGAGCPVEEDYKCKMAPTQEKSAKTHAECFACVTVSVQDN